MARGADGPMHAMPRRTVRPRSGIDSVFNQQKEIEMIKLTSILAASALALSLSGVSFAADEKTQDQPGTPPEQSKQDHEYLMALKKCESLQEAAKQKCIEQARQKYNRM
jgi:hypothetical protein